jgi:hypothetical protein
VDQLGITDESCILGKALDKDFLSGTQELRKSGKEGKLNIRTEELPWERSRSLLEKGWKAMT